MTERTIPLLPEAEPARLRAVAGLLGAPPAPTGVLLSWPGPAHLDPDQRPRWWTDLAGRLPPGGVAAVRVDMLPGWRTLTAIQDFGRFHASRKGLSLQQALDQVWSLSREVLEDEGRWAGWLELTRELRRAHPEVLSDLTRAPLHPAELHTWVAEARQSGLTWLGDARGPNQGTWRHAAPLRAWIEEEGRGDRLRGEQIADYARCQHTRLLLFVRGELGPTALPAAVGPGADEPWRWAFEAPQVAEPDLPAGAAEVVRRVAAAGSWLPAGSLADVPELAAAVKAAWEAGAIAVRSDDVD